MCDTRPEYLGLQNTGSTVSQWKYHLSEPSSQGLEGSTLGFWSLFLIAVVWVLPTSAPMSSLFELPG